MTPYFKYCHCTNTIRLMPGNLLILFRYDKRWMLDIDASVNETMAKRIFEVFFTNPFRTVMIGNEMVDRFNRDVIGL